MIRRDAIGPYMNSLTSLHFVSSHGRSLKVALKKRKVSEYKGVIVYGKLEGKATTKEEGNENESRGN
jgi:hypothetical protein